MLDNMKAREKSARSVQVVRDGNHEHVTACVTCGEVNDKEKHGKNIWPQYTVLWAASSSVYCAKEILS
jgi:hypothetical protein